MPLKESKYDELQEEWKRQIDKKTELIFEFLEFQIPGEGPTVKEIFEWDTAFHLFLARLMIKLYASYPHLKDDVLTKMKLEVDNIKAVMKKIKENPL